ncbi:MAG: transporter substrate-binding domain-containing protein [Lachnospiraceae bacterium]|nr:transporter substrate-binding domain-containing protein [Lachnospiraceae bacterium]
MKLSHKSLKAMAAALCLALMVPSAVYAAPTDAADTSENERVASSAAQRDADETTETNAGVADSVEADMVDSDNGNESLPETSDVEIAATAVPKRELVRVGFFAMDGYHMVDDEGRRSGYGYDFTRMMGRYLNVDFEYVGYDKSWDEMLTMLENGEIDLLTSARKNPEREARFDFSRPIGSSYAIMTICEDNRTIVPQDYKTYQHIKVGFLRGNSRNEDFTAFASENGFSYVPVYFDSTAAMENALHNGEVDALVTSSLRDTQREHIVERFDASDIYAIVKDGNTQLLDKVNYAIDQMNSIDPDWKETLSKRYYEDANRRVLDFTDSEKEIIANCSSEEESLKILSDPTCFPYSYVEKGEVKGIIPDYFSAVADYIGLHYEFVPCESRDDYLALQADPDIDVWIDAYAPTENWAEVHGLTMTVPYITLHVAELTRTDFDGTINTVGTVRQGFAYSIAEQYAPEADKVVFATREEAMASVQEGKTDISYVFQYSAQEYVNRDRSGTVIYRVLESPTYQYRMAIAQSQNHALAGILTKGIYAMPDELMQRIAVEHISYKAEKLSVLDLMKIHPIEATVGVMLVMIVIFLILFFFLKMRVRIRNQANALKQAEEMKLLAEKADAANRAKTDFLFNMSHDIRTPMNAIIGYSRLVKNELTDPKLLDYHEKIEHASSVLLSLINNVLDMARIESGKLDLNEVVVDTDRIEAEVMSIFGEEARKKNLTIINDWQMPRHKMYCDPTKVKEIFINIISNAVKYTPDGGTITIRTRELPTEKEGYVRIKTEIEDTGIGMSPDYLPHVFDAFTRERNTTTGKVEGTGLGMPIVKALVNLMGGTISVDSELGKGTIFTLILEHPLAPEVTQKAELQLSDEEKMACLQGKRILLAEDNELNAEIALAILEEYGLQVDHVEDGALCVARMEEMPADRYDLILMDIQMPNMDGYTATRSIRAFTDPLKAAIPILAMTANAFDEDRQNALDAGMNGHVAKPIDVAKLEAALIDILYRKKSD